MGVKPELNGCTDCQNAGKDYIVPADVVIRTSDGQNILAHSSILASTSPVLEKKIVKARRVWNSVCTIHISGVSSDSVTAFVQLLYSKRIAVLATPEMDDLLEKHGMQLLAMSHVYRVGWLKKKCETTVATELTPNRVINVLKVAKLCDAPRLYQQCMKLITKEFAEVRRSDGWQFLKRYDPLLELEILEIMEDTDQRKRKWKQQRKVQVDYQRLNEAMYCLQHIFTEGCTEIGPQSGNLSRGNKGPCASFATCQGLQLLLCHFYMCGKKLAPGGCLQCQRMWQLLHLHSSICNHSDSCKVPLCNDGRFKTKIQREGRSDKTWRLLVERVAMVRAMSGLATRKMPDIVFSSWAKYRAVSNRTNLTRPFFN